MDKLILLVRTAPPSSLKKTSDTGKHDQNLSFLNVSGRIGTIILFAILEQFTSP